MPNGCISTLVALLFAAPLGARPSELPPSAADPAVKPARRALIVAVEDYDEARGWPRLRGTRRDAAAMVEALLRRGFERENLSILVDEEATRAGILAAFDALVEKSRAGDVLLFYFAGHGSRVPDRGGDEADGFDETLIPFDATLPDGSPNDILDDDVHDMIARANEHTDHVVLVFDCCSSGTNVRGDDDAVPRYVAPETRGLAGVREGDAARPRGASAPSYVDRGGNYVALSACRAAESAYEVRLEDETGARVYRGLFTACLVDELEGGGALTYENLLRSVRARIHDIRSDQTPLAEGPLASRALFAGGGPDGATAFVIERTEAGEVLRAGLANGLRPGAELSVHADPAAAARRESPVGHIRLDEVGPVSAGFTWIEGAAPLPEAERLWAAPGAAAADGLPISIEAPDDAEAAAELERRATETGLLRRSSGTDAAFRVVLEQGEWSVRGPDGTRLPPHARATDSGETAELVRALTLLARARLLERSVRHADEPALAVETAIERLDENGHPVEPIEPTAAGPPALTAQDRFGCRLTNRSKVPVFATLLLFSPDGEISILLRPQNLDDAIPPGATVRSPPLRLVLNPDSEPFYHAGVERFRWVVTTELHDLRNLRQPSATSPATRGAPLAAPKKALGPLELRTWITASAELRMRLGD